jgi:hypothetical protein
LRVERDGRWLRDVGDERRRASAGLQDSPQGAYEFQLSEGALGGIRRTTTEVYSGWQLLLDFSRTAIREIYWELNR